MEAASPATPDYEPDMSSLNINCDKAPQGTPSFVANRVALDLATTTPNPVMK